MSDASTSSNGATTIDTDSFITEVKKEVDEGYGFVPFLGSGVSFSSGIMTGAHIGDYLIYVIYQSIKSLAVPIGSNEARQYSKCPIDSIEHDYSVARFGWPERPKQKDIEDAKDWFKSVNESLINSQDRNTCFDNSEWYTEYLGFAIGMATKSNDSELEDYSQILFQWEKSKDEKGLFEALYLPRKGVSRHSSEYICECAIRSLSNWKDMLQFLARLKVKQNSYIISETPDHSIIDGMNVNMVRGKRPNLIHYTLAHLIHPMRIRRMLTTNFDDLLELAMRQANQPMDIYSVERNSRLPDPVSVYQGLSLIKLHGTLHETRADYTLDNSPSFSDKERFRQYLIPESNHGFSGVPNHFLVLGYSFEDQRIVELCKFVLNSNRNIKLFYVGYDEETDYKRLKKHFGSEYHERIKVCFTKLLDLFLTELHAQLARSLAPGGFTHQYVHYVPPILKKDNKYLHDNKELLELYETYQDLSKGGKECYWLELDDYQSPAECFTDMLSIIAIRNGIFHCEHFDIHFEKLEERQTKFADHVNSILTSFGVDPGKIYVFYNNCNLPGRSSGWLEYNNQKWEDNQNVLFDNTLREFNQNSNKYGYHFKSGSINKLTGKEEFLPKIFPKDKEECIKIDKSKLASPNYNSIFEFTEDNSVFDTSIRSFLHSLLLFRESRNEVVFFSSSSYLGSYFLYRKGTSTQERSGSHIDTEKIDPHTFKDIRQSLLDNGLFFKKEGGYLWTDIERKSELSKILGFGEANNPDTTEARLNYNSEHERFHTQGALHFEIAESYLKAFFSSNHAEPLIDAFYHQFQSLDALRKQIKSLASAGELPDSTIQECKTRLLMLFYFIVKTIRYSKSSLQFWMPEHAVNNLFSEHKIVEALYQNSTYQEEEKKQRLTWNGFEESIFENSDIEKTGAEESNNSLDPLLNDAFMDMIAQFDRLRKEIKNDGFLDLSANRMFRFSGSNGTNFSETSSTPKINANDGVHDIAKLLETAPEDINHLTTIYQKRIQSIGRIQVLYTLGNALPLSQPSSTETLKSYQGLPLEELQNALFDKQSSGELLSIAQASNLCDVANKMMESARFYARYEKATKYELACKVRTYINHIEDVERDTSKKQEVRELTHFLEYWLGELATEHETSEGVGDIKKKYRCSDKFATLQRRRILTHEALALLNDYLPETEQKTLNTLFPTGGNTPKDIPDLAGKYVERRALSLSYWAIVRDFSIYVYELLRFVHPIFVYQESALKIQLLTLKGLSLSKLGSYDGAQSALNQASALTFAQPLRENLCNKATIDLRRAEVYMQEALSYRATLVHLEHKLKNALPNDESYLELSNSFITHYRRHVASLDSATALLDSSENHLSGNSHSSFLWGRLYIQRFSILSSYYISGSLQDRLKNNMEGCILDNGKFAPAFRLKACNVEHSLSVFRKSLAVCEGDEYLKYSMLNAYIKAAKKTLFYMRFIYNDELLDKNTKKFSQAIKDITRLFELNFSESNLNTEPKQYEEFYKQIEICVSDFTDGSWWKRVKDKEVDC